MMAIMQMNDDIYDGYNNYPSVYSIKDLEQDEYFHEAVTTSYGRRSLFTAKAPGTAMRLGTSTGVSKLKSILEFQARSEFHRSGTGISIRPTTSGVRPMTAVRGAGYTSSSRQAFDPLNMGNTVKGAAPPLESGKEDT